MSLNALTDRIQAGRSMVRTLLLLIALTGGIIVGLLAMHSLNAHPTSGADHRPVVATATSVSTDDQHSGATATGETCEGCGSGHSEMLAMAACVLALMAAVLLLARARPSQVWLAILSSPQQMGHTPPGTRLRVRPPSLIVLCISRT